ncbi:CrcB family protein [Demequina sp. TTPB684]|uniref:CrcB family protein n=1 Tax=unclassified Demequina TaxID=2620311 RepID=UPI001CF178B8|nr:CrcB family protein [Demequina sp. TMPB413]MCB2412096.1 CrcB family protein [Demequina sp. TTPB684]UPU88533.1 CrcB family protein [Demequina sp. TMPB413]
MTAKIYGVVFAGAVVGGAARLAIDELFTAERWAWDIVVINVLGSALLGALMGWYSAHAAPWWVPGLGPGLLGGFTTFSAMAAPHPGAPLPALVLLGSTLALAALSAGAGWWCADTLAVRLGARERDVDADRIEAEVEGYRHDEVAP